MLHREIVEIVNPAPSLLEAIGKLRVTAWKTSVPAAGAMKVWVDELDSSAVHFLIWENDLLIASARVSFHNSLDSVPHSEAFAGSLKEQIPTPIASINRLVVHPDFRGLGLSRILDDGRIRLAFNKECQSVLGTPIGRSRVKQLQALGFKQYGVSHGPISHGPISHGPVSNRIVPVLVLLPSNN